MKSLRDPSTIFWDIPAGFIWEILEKNPEHISGRVLRKISITISEGSSTSRKVSERISAEPNNPGEILCAIEEIWDKCKYFFFWSYL